MIFVCVCTCMHVCVYVARARMWRLGYLGSWFSTDLVIRLEDKHPHPLSHLTSLSAIL